MIFPVILLEAISSVGSIEWGAKGLIIALRVRSQSGAARSVAVAHPGTEKFKNDKTRSSNNRKHRNRRQIIETYRHPSNVIILALSHEVLVLHTLSV